MTSSRLRVLTKDGVKVIEVKSADDASRVSAHWRAVTHFRRTGEGDDLEGFENDLIEGEPLETDLDAIEEWGLSGELDFDDLYDR